MAGEFKEDRQAQEELRSWPVSRVLSRGRPLAAVIHLDLGLPQGLKPPTRGLGEQRHCPPIWCCSGWRLPRFTRKTRSPVASRLVSVALFLAFAYACAQAYSGRALPGTPLFGARTFLNADYTAPRPPGQLPHAFYSR
jgi:hypothetical protein